MFTATDKKLRDKEYENLKQLYYSTLTNQIEKLGSNAQKLFSYEDFEKQLKQFGTFALFMPTVLIFISLSQSEISSEIANETNEDLEKVYAEKINGLLTDVLNFGYYNKL